MLSKSDKAAIRRARLLLLAGDRAGAAKLLRGMEGLEVRGDGLAATFRCDRLHIEQLRISECLWRRSMSWPSGAAKGSSRNHPIAAGCVGCPVGAVFARQFPRYVPAPPTMAPEVMPLEQRKAKMRRALIVLDHMREEDPLTQAAHMTPSEWED